MEPKKETPLEIEARETVKDLYLKFQKDLSHQQAAATLTLAIVMKEVLLTIASNIGKSNGKSKV